MIRSAHWSYRQFSFNLAISQNVGSILKFLNVYQGVPPKGETTVQILQTYGHRNVLSGVSAELACTHAQFWEGLGKEGGGGWTGEGVERGGSETVVAQLVSG